MKLQFKRGLQANLPVLDVGEPGLTIDQNRVFIGGTSGNIELAKKGDLIPGPPGPVGPSNAEIDAARYDSVNGVAYDTLGGRLDASASQLADITNIQNGFYNKPKTGKKIVWKGDSTTEFITPGLDRWASWYTVSGGVLEGAIVTNRGSNGEKVQDFINNVSYNGNTLQACINDKADLYIFSMGINDIRDQVSSPRTPAQIRADIKTAVDALLSQTKGYILLRTPNPFLSKDAANLGTLQPVSSAQEYSNQLWEIYEWFRGYSPRVDVIDIPNIVFGRQARGSHALMANIIHPNTDGYRAIADAIAEHICAQKRNFDFVDYEQVMWGSIESTSISNSILSFFTSNRDAQVRIGDTIVVGNSWSFVVTQQPTRNQYKWYVPHTHVGDYSRYGTVKVLRRKDRILPSPKAQNNWFRASVDSTSSAACAVELVVDLQAYGLTGSKNIYTSFSFYTKDSMIRQIMCNIVFNNSPVYGDYTSPVNVNLPAIDVFQNEPGGYEQQQAADITGQRYAHVTIQCYIGQSGLRELLFSNFSLVIGGASINLSNNEWRAVTNAGLNSMIIPNIHGHHTFFTAPDVLDEIANAPNNLNTNANWNKASITTTDTQIFMETVIDLNAYGSYSASMHFDAKLKYFTSLTQHTNIKVSYWFNNTATAGSLGSAVTQDGKILTTVIGKIANYFDVRDYNPNGNRYLHLLVVVSTSSGAGNVFQFGEVGLAINGANVDFTNLTWNQYGGQAGSKVDNSIYRRDIIMTYDGLISTLKKLGLIS